MVETRIDVGVLVEGRHGMRAPAGDTPIGCTRGRLGAAGVMVEWRRGGGPF